MVEQSVGLGFHIAEHGRQGFIHAGQRQREFNPAGGTVRKMFRSPGLAVF